MSSARSFAPIGDGSAPCTSRSSTPSAVFLRISQHFENRLDPARWDNDLLQKMTLEIEGVRVAAVSEAAFPPPFELLEFRHFKRCYFELEYDWDRLDYLVAKLRQAHPLVMDDLARFERFTRAADGP